MALDRMSPLGKRTHVLEILEVVTALFEFTARMADWKIFINHIGIAWDRNLDGWCQEHTISIDTIHPADELCTGRCTLALDVALKVYAAFGWENPPKDELAAVQRQRFG